MRAAVWHRPSLHCRWWARSARVCRAGRQRCCLARCSTICTNEAELGDDVSRAAERQARHQVCVDVPHKLKAACLVQNAAVL
eukprot:5322022-Pyramimonas_sp.AAC.1